MPCDARLLTFNEMLRTTTQRLAASDKRLTECRTQIEKAKTGVQTAQDRLHQAIRDEERTRQAYVDWSNHLKTLRDDSSPPMLEKSKLLFNASAQAVADTRSARETASTFQKTLDIATADFASAQDTQRKLTEERNVIATEIAKLSIPGVPRRTLA